jgi:hypothetical protein
MLKGKRWDLLSYGLVILSIILLVAICSSGCVSVLDEEDWNRFGEKMEKRLVDAGIEQERAKLETDEAIEDLREVEALTVEKINEMGKQIKDFGIEVVGGITGMPEIIKEGSKDFTDDLMKWLLLGGGGTAVLGGLGASMRNSKEKKIFGPIFNGKKEMDDRLNEYQKKIIELMDEKLKT